MDFYVYLPKAGCKFESHGSLELNFHTQN